LNVFVLPKKTPTDVVEGLAERHLLFGARRVHLCRAVKETATHSRYQS